MRVNSWLLWALLSAASDLLQACIFNGNTIVAAATILEVRMGENSSQVTVSETNVGLDGEELTDGGQQASMRYSTIHCRPTIQ